MSSQRELIEFTEPDLEGLLSIIKAFVRILINVYKKRVDSIEIVVNYFDEAEEVEEDND